VTSDTPNPTASTPSSSAAPVAEPAVGAESAAPEGAQGETSTPEPKGGAATAPARRPPGRDGLMMKTPTWMMWGSNIGAVVVVVGGIFLAVQITDKLKHRVKPKPFPSLAQLADSLRRFSPAVVQDTAGEQQRAAATLARPMHHVLGGPSPADSFVRAGQQALARGRMGEAWRAFSSAARDSTNASAALGTSLLAGWRLDEGTARQSLARAARLRAALSPPERRLLEAHQRWLAGDIHGSDSLYRTLLMEVNDDPTLWYAASFVHRHDGGVIDSALIAYGSPVARSLVDQPTRRVSHAGAIPALWRVLQLSPYHEAARLDLLRFAALYDDRRLANWLGWGSELYAVEPATRFAMRAVAADAKHDTSAWKIVLRLASDAAARNGTRAGSAADSVASLPPDAVTERDIFEASRAIATSAGILNPLSLWHAAEVLIPLTNPAQHAPAVVATAHAWRGQFLFALSRPINALEEFHAAAAADSSIGLPLAAWTAWLSARTDTATLNGEYAALEAWSAPLTANATRDWLHPHRGMEPHVRAYGLGLLAAALGDTTRVLQQAAALDKLPAISGDTALKLVMTSALRAEAALARDDFKSAIAMTANAEGLLPPIWRELSPFSGRIHARYRRAFAQQRSWENEGARIAFVAFFSPTVPEIPIYRPARGRFDNTP